MSVPLFQDRELTKEHRGLVISAFLTYFDGHGHCPGTPMSQKISVSHARFYAWVLMARDEFYQVSDFTLETEEAELISLILLCLPSLQHWISWYVIVICRMRQTRQHEWIGPFKHCVSENREEEKIPFLCTVHTPAFEERRRVNTAPTLLGKLISLSKIFKSWQCYTITLRKILFLFQRLSHEDDQL